MAEQKKSLKPDRLFFMSILRIFFSVGSRHKSHSIVNSNGRLCIEAAFLIHSMFLGSFVSQFLVLLLKFYIK